MSIAINQTYFMYLFVCTIPPIWCQSMRFESYLNIFLYHLLCQHLADSSCVIKLCQLESTRNSLNASFYMQFFHLMPMNKILNLVENFWYHVHCQHLAENFGVIKIFHLQPNRKPHMHDSMCKFINLIAISKIWMLFGDFFNIT